MYTKLSTQQTSLKISGDTHFPVNTLLSEAISTLPLMHGNSTLLSTGTLQTTMDETPAHRQHRQTLATIISSAIDLKSMISRYTAFFCYYGPFIFPERQ